LSTRGKKNIVESEIKVQVALYAFDCLYLNGVPLLREPMVKRREALYSAFQEVPGEFFFVTEKTSRDIDELQGFLDESIKDNTEGLIVKTLDATYEPSKRSLNWLKLKKDYMEGCGDSLDLVPIGAWLGRGKRTGVYGAYLLACYDEENEEYQTICKIGTGFSEEQLVELADGMNPHTIDGPRTYYKVADSLKPDVWFEPKQVWEVKAADLSISPVHRAAAGLVDPVKGIALRFPRFLRRREDKEPEMATSAEQVADFYNAQANKQEFAGGDDA
jgi:DNA ligase-1